MLRASLAALAATLICGLSSVPSLAREQTEQFRDGQVAEGARLIGEPRYAQGRGRDAAPGRRGAEPPPEQEQEQAAPEEPPPGAAPEPPPPPPTAKRAPPPPPPPARQQYRY
jgi:hypothetical protein